MAEAAEELGIDPVRIRRFSESIDTAHEALLTRQLMRDKPVLLVTSAVHMRRSLLWFREMKVNAIPAPCDFITPVSERGRKALDLSRSTPRGAAVADSDTIWHEALGIAYFHLAGKSSKGGELRDSRPEHRSPAAMDDLSDRKKLWRRLAVDTFSLVSPAARRALDMKLIERVREFVTRSGAGTLLGFAPMADEPDLLPFFRRWLAGGGALVLPVWLGGAEMLLRRVADLDGGLRPGRGGILEPVDGSPVVSPGEIDLAITPGRFFSERGDRLGRGAGCYDALFRENRLLKAGVAYDFQVFPEIPAGDGDVPLDAVITPSRTVLIEEPSER
jgi:5-formyltetrahydrofolate cyclo-ligase